MSNNLSSQFGINRRTFTDEIVIGNLYQRSVKVIGLDVTSYVGRCHWADVSWDDPNLGPGNIIFNTDNGINPTELDLTDPSGVFIVTISDTQAATLTAGTKLYGDLEIDNSAGSVLTAARFITTVRGSVSG